MNHAKDLMTKDPIVIQSGWEIREAIHVFQEHNIHSAPVVTPLGEVLGMMTELSLVKASLRNYLDSGKSEKVVHHSDILEAAFFVNEEDSVGEVVKAMFQAPHHRILVMNKNKKIVGFISPKDIIGFVTKFFKMEYRLQ
jgi:predicted transcriptional regulator